MNDSVLQSILVVDDDPFMFEYIKAVLGDRYTLHHSADGAHCLQVISEIQPALVLLDARMPGMDGFEVCRSLREDSNFDDLAVVFISASCEAEDRLRAYDVGANDYLTKPIAPKELVHKVASAISSRQEIRELRASNLEAFSVAMTAMTDAGTIGRILNLFREMFAAESFQQIGRQILAMLSEMNIQATVQIRGRKEVFTEDTTGRQSAMEAVMLRDMSKSSQRISEFGSRLSVVYGPVSLLVRNAPDGEAERGRLRDYAAYIVEGAAERVKSMDGASLEALVDHTEKVLNTIAADYGRQQTTMINAFNLMLEDFQHALLHTGLSAQQEDELITIVQTAMLHARDTQALGQAIDKHIQDLKQRFAAERTQ